MNRSEISTRQIDPAWSVNQLVARFPECMPLLEEYDVDTCCGGDLALEHAARDADIDLALLMDRLQGVIEDAR